MNHLTHFSLAFRLPALYNYQALCFFRIKPNQNVKVVEGLIRPLTTHGHAKKIGGASRE
jgi:hypothetical protein